ALPIYAGHHLGAEGLVDLEAIDILDGDAGLVADRLDRRHRSDPHYLRPHADAGAGDDACQRLLPAAVQIVSGHHDGRRGTVDHSGTVAAGLHAAESRPDFRQHLHRRRPDMGVFRYLRRLAAEPDAALVVAREFEFLAGHRRDLASQKAALFRPAGT